MNRSFVVAAAGIPPHPGSPRQVITVTKPQGDQAVTLHLTGSAQLDLSSIANESITLVHVGDRLVILFDNHAQVTLDPFFGDSGQPLADVTVELAPGRDVSSAEFASLFPISDDPSVLPAAGGGSPAAGAYFASFAIDTFGPAGTGLSLLAAEGTGGVAPGVGNTPAPIPSVPMALTGATILAAVDEGGLVTDTIGTVGNDAGLPFGATGAPGSLNALVSFGSGGANAHPFQFVPASAAGAVLAGLGLTSHGAAIDTATITASGGDYTLVASTDPHQATPHDVFSLVIHADGSWSFTLLAPLDDPPGQGENAVTLDLSGLIQAVDAAGLTETLANDFKIAVTDDVPVAHPVAATTGEPINLTVTPSVGHDFAFGADGAAGASSITFDTQHATIVGPSGEVLGTPAYQINGGSIEIDPGTTFAQLGVGQTATLDIPYTVTDFDGDSATSDIVVTINGVNEAPQFAGGSETISGAVTERAGVTGSTAADTATGALHFTDIDYPDNHTVSASYVASSAVWSGGSTIPAQTLVDLAQAATFVATEVTDSTHEAVGEIDWTFSLADKDFDFLAQGEILTVTYNVTIDDHHGGTVSEPVTVTITGTDDTPSIVTASTTNSGAFGELAITTGSSAKDTAGGTITFADPDFNDTHAVTQATPTFAWSGGTLSTAQQSALAVASSLALAESDSTHSSSGTGTVGWTYQVTDGALDFLAAGETLVVTYNVTIDDHHTGGTVSEPVTVTITGTDDVPTIVTASTTHTGAFSELANTTSSPAKDSAGGTITFADPDFNDTHAVTQATPTFAWSGGTLSTAQQSALAVASSLALAESDSTHSSSGTGTVGWTYQVTDGALDFLAVGETLTVTCNVTIDDHQGGTVSEPVTVTITGTNDVPTILTGSTTHAGAFSVGSSAKDSATGTITFADPDFNDAHAVTQTAPTFGWSGGTLNTAEQSALAAAGSLVLVESDSTHSSNGTGTVGWTYQVNNSALVFLGASETLTVTYDVTIDDHHGGTVVEPITVTITGADDPPVITSSPWIVDVTEDASFGPATNLVANGTFASFSYNGFYTVNGWTTYSSNLYPPGVGSYGHADADALDVTPVPNTTGTVSQTITDAAGALYQLVFWAVPTGGSPAGTNSIAALWDGQSVVSAADVTAISATNPSHGGSQYTEYAVDVVGTGSDQLTFAFTTNYYWFISDVSLTPVLTPGTESRTGTITFTDPNVSDTHTVTSVADGTGYIGAFSAVETHDTTGSGAGGTVDWTFTVSDSAIQYLAAGQTLTQTYTVTVNDGHGGTASQNVTVTLNGVNEAPIVTSGAQTGGVTENVTAPGVEKATGSISFTDVDLTDTHTVTVTPGASGYLGTLTAALGGDSTGGQSGAVNWTYSVNDSAIAFLGANQTLTQAYTVTVDDGHGGTATQNVVVTLHGVNDAPVLNTADTVALSNEAQPSLANLVNNPSFDSNLNGWTASSRVSQDTTHHHTGAGDVENNSTSSTAGTLSQSITTVAGQQYTLTFWVEASNTSGDSFTASWNGSQVVSLANSQLSSTFVQETFQVTGAAASTSTTLSFTLKDTASGQHVFLDDVSVTPVSPFLPSGAVGTLVSSLVGIGGGPGNVSDADSGAATGIAITAADTTNGTWFYSTNNGTTWQTFTASTTNALLLAADGSTRIYFSPAGGAFAGTANITFDAWDQTIGSNGGTANAGVTGGSSAFSAASETVSLTVGAAANNALTSGSDTVFLVNGPNTVSATSSTLNGPDSLTGSGADTLNLNLSAASGGYSFNFGAMTKFIGFTDVMLSANPATSVSLTFGNANILSGQTLTVDGHLDTTQSFTVNASGVTDGGNFIFIAAQNTSNTFSGGSGNNLYEFSNANLAASDHITGGAGTNTLWLTDTTSFTVNDAAFTNVNAVGILQVGGGGTDTLNLGTNASHDVGGAGHTLTIDDTGATGTGNLVVNGSAMTANLLIELTNAHFTSSDAIAGGSGTDTIQLVDAAGVTVTDAAFTHVSSIETLKIGGSGADSVTVGALASADVGGAGHTLTIDDSTGTGALTVNGSSMTANLTVELTGASFTSADHIAGGSGSDAIQLVDSTGIVVNDTAFANVSSIETLKLGGAATNSVTLGADASADVGGLGHTFTLDDSAATGNLMLDGSAMTANLNVLLDGVGGDILTGGAGNDIFDFLHLPSQAADQITNFNNTTQHDQIAVSASGFGGGLTVGEDVTSVFQTAANATFTSTSERFQFDTANHTLYYSAGGSAGTAIALAQLEAGVMPTGHDIHVVA